MNHIVDTKAILEIFYIQPLSCLLIGWVWSVVGIFSFRGGNSGLSIPAQLWSWWTRSLPPIHYRPLFNLLFTKHSRLFFHRRKRGRGRSGKQGDNNTESCVHKIDRPGWSAWAHHSWAAISPEFCCKGYRGTSTLIHSITLCPQSLVPARSSPAPQWLGWRWKILPVPIISTVDPRPKSAPH